MLRYRDVSRLWRKQMKFVSWMNRTADNTLSKLIGQTKASASCTPFWETYCVNSGVCGGGVHSKFRRYHLPTCDTCCEELVGCC